MRSCWSCILTQNLSFGPRPATTTLVQRAGIIAVFRWQQSPITGWTVRRTVAPVAVEIRSAYEAGLARGVFRSIVDAEPFRLVTDIIHVILDRLSTLISIKTRLHDSTARCISLVFLAFVNHNLKNWIYRALQCWNSISKSLIEWKP